MILRLLRDQLLYPTNQKSKILHMSYYLGGKNPSPAIMHLVLHYEPAAGM